MPLETATYISDLVSSNPAATDSVNQGDDHLRLLKSSVKATFPGVNAAAARTIGASYGFLVGDGNGSTPSYGFASNLAMGFYVYNSVTVGLAGSLNLNGTITTPLTISGGNGTFSGALSGASLSIAGTGTLTGALSAASGAFSGAVSGTTATFTSNVSGVNGTFSGAVSGASGAFSGAVSGTTGTFTSNVSGVNGTFSGALSGASAAISGNQTVGGNLTVTGTGTFGTVVGALPAGAIMDFAGTTAPSGWAACDGGVVSRTTFAQLFANIGTTWGVGDGSTTFGLPQFGARFRRHRDGNLAATVGTYQSPVNLTHDHTYNGTTSDVSAGHTHTYSGTSAVNNVDHTHTYSGTSAANNVDHFHGYSGDTGAMSANAAHTHQLTNSQNVYLTSINNGNLTNQGNVMVTGGGSAVTITTSSTNTDHSHSYSGNTAGANTNHTHTYSGTSAGANTTHTHTYSGTTSGVSGGHTHNYSGTTSAQGDGNECRPYSATVLTCIKLFN